MDQEVQEEIQDQIPMDQVNVGQHIKLIKSLLWVSRAHRLKATTDFIKVEGKPDHNVFPLYA